jgi:hypothetical protein
LFAAPITLPAALAATVNNSSSSDATISTTDMEEEPGEKRTRF